MALKKVPLYQKPLSFVTVDPEATKGAVVGVNLYAQNGAVILLEHILNPAPTEPGLEYTYWRLIMEIPPNVVALAETATTGLYAITAAGTSATRQIQPAIGRTTVSNGDGVAGDPVVDLDVFVDSGVGAALVKITRDAYGRVEGTEAATTDDLPEGTSNLYFTDARADARISLQKGQPLGLGTLDADGKLDTGQLPALAITKTFVVASQAAMLALTVEEGDVAVRTDLNMSFILTAAPASTLSNWQELLTPMSPVTSVFGRVGSVTAASGDYTAAQVGADPVGSAAAAQSAAQTYADGKVAASITNGDTTHAPSGDAVFDALALKQDKAAASDFITAYGAGTVYTVTATSAAIVQGTSSPAIVLPAAGTYLIRGFARLFDSSSTHATNRNWFAVFRRTNNTAADIANSTIAWGLGIKASGSNSTVGVVQMPEIIYTTTNNNDALTIFTNLSALPDSGAYQISAAQIIAQKLY